MGLKKDVRSVTEMKTGAARLLDQVNAERRPIVVTKDGRPRGVLMDVDSYEEMRNALGLMALAMEGMDEIRTGPSLSHAGVSAFLRKRYGPAKRHARARS